MEPEDPAVIAIYDLLTGPGVSPWVTTKIGDRMYPVQAPDATPPPYLVYSQLGEEVVSTKDGNIPNGWSFDVQIFAESSFHASKIGVAVRKSIDGKTTAVEEIGDLYLSFVDEMDMGFDEKRNLFVIGLNFRAKK